MPIYGTTYGGWWLPGDLHLNANSFVVSAGVGEDISFDLALQAATGCEILLLDPTSRAIAHVDGMNRWFAAKDPSWFPAATNPTEYCRVVKDLDVDMTKLVFQPVGLWSAAGHLRFYKQDNPAYVSQSLLADMYTTDYTVVPVDRLSRILEGRRPDLVKLDIEGAELAVLETMLDDGILPRYLCVEYDYAIKGKDTDGQTAGIMRRLEEAGYKVLHNAALNVTYQRAL